MKNLVIVIVAMMSSVAFAQVEQSVTYHNAGGGTSTWTPPVPAATPVVTVSSSADPTGTVTLRGGIASARPPSTGDPQIDRENNRSDLEWGRLALQRERERERAELERARQAEQYLARAMEYDLRRREQERRTVESWSRVIGNQLNDKARRDDLKDRREQERRRDAQNHQRQMARDAQRRAQQALRDAHRN